MAGIVWVVVAAILFGSQFVLRKLCPAFSSAAYNLSMALGILAGSLASLAALGVSSIAPSMAALAFVAGIAWVAGNYLFIVAVELAGMSRSYVAINFSAVLSFVGGIVVLGELPDLGGARLLLVAGAVALVLLGSYLVVTTAPRDGGRGEGGARAAKGLVAGFAATAFFSAYNVMTAYVLNRAATPAGITLVAVAPGIVVGALLLAPLADRRLLRDWRAAPARWHLTAFAQGLVWAAAMVCILFGWMGVGIAMGTSVQVGVQTLVSALWGVLVFRELAGSADKRATHARFVAGAVLTVAGIVLLASG